MRPASLRRCQRCRRTLARDYRFRHCPVCKSELRDGPPTVPVDFWSRESIRVAAAERHMGRLIAAYRAHPMHGAPIPQEVVGLWALKEQSQISKIEKGPAVTDLVVLQFWARLLGIPDDLLWFAMPQPVKPQPAG